MFPEWGRDHHPFPQDGALPLIMADSWGVSNYCHFLGYGKVAFVEFGWLPDFFSWVHLPDRSSDKGFNWRQMFSINFAYILCIKERGTKCLVWVFSDNCRYSSLLLNHFQKMGLWPLSNSSHCTFSRGRVVKWLLRTSLYLS